MSSNDIGHYDVRSVWTRLSLSQRAVLAASIWWLLPLIGCSLLWPSLWNNLSTMHHKTVLGLSLMINGWHVLFHLGTAIVGFLLLRSERLSTLWAIFGGALYFALGVIAYSGIGTLNPMGMMQTDVVGNSIHLIEGPLLFFLGCVSLSSGRLGQSTGSRPPDSLVNTP